VNGARFSRPCGEDMDNHGRLNPLRHHNKRHRDIGVSFEDCVRCGLDRAVCRRKIRLASWQEANEWVEDFNVEHQYVDPVTRYRCRWCDGWHLKTAKDPRTRARMERQRRKWAAAGKPTG
jgi:hypothetical protein